MIRESDLHLEHAGTHRKMIDGWSVHTSEGFLRFYADGRIAITLFVDREAGNRQEQTIGWFDDGVYCIEAGGGKLAGFLFCKAAVDILTPDVYAVRVRQTAQEYAVPAETANGKRKEVTRKDGSYAVYHIPLDCFLKESNNDWTE